MLNKFQTKQDRKQQQGINEALKAWSLNHETRLPVKPMRPISKPQPKINPSTMCELGLIIPLERKS
jgi:hypothetical protein